MSYIAYINGNQLELLESSPIAYTKQVNDLAALSNRQSNFTQKFILPFTANNKKAMEFVYMVGNQSNLPYQKNEFDLIDSDSGKHLIYKGWAIVSQTTNKGYEINVYDGNIDFFKAIENKTLTDIDITALDHTKNLTNVINSFTTNLPYKYIIADYNGKNTDVVGTTSPLVNLNINIDYQLPSARISFIWDRIFNYFGFTYTGSVFQTEKFLNLFMTYPKPVPSLVPLLEAITSQQSTMTDRWVQQPDWSYIIFFDVHFFPTPVTNPRLTINNIGLVEFNQSGTYRLKCSGVFTCSYNGGTATQSGMIGWTLTGPGAMTTTNTTSGQINAENSEEVIISANAGQRLFLQAPWYVSSGGVVTSIDFVLGYDASFSDALIDFKVTDFIKEIVQRFGLTMFKDKYTNNIDFLTLKEVLDNNNTIDWSDKFSEKVSEKYIYGTYAQRNNFKYKYNDENDSHNDGYIEINNENLNDEKVIINSKIYSPEKGKALYGNCDEVFKFWNKEVKDNGTIEYKELNERYYFLRSENITYTTGLEIGSKVLNQHQIIDVISAASYSRLSFQEIIEDNYSAIESVLNKAKVLEANLFLKPIDVENFDFKKLVYIEQLASYYLVNKINNFVKGKLTKCELIEVDKGVVTIVPPPPIIYTIQLGSISQTV